MKVPPQPSPEAPFTGWSGLDTHRSNQSKKLWEQRIEGQLHFSGYANAPVVKAGAHQLFQVYLNGGVQARVSNAAPTCFSRSEKGTKTTD